MKYLTGFVFIIVLALSASARAENAMRVVVFGDSLTAGYQLQAEEAYPAQLEKKLKDIGFKVSVINKSVTGATTTDGLNRTNDVIALRPDVVVLEFGGNDAIRGVDANIIYKNLANIAGRLFRERIYVVLLGIKAPESRGTTYAYQVETLYYTLAEHMKLPFYPNILEGISEKPEYNLADGYHPNARGVSIMVENTYALVDAGLRWRWEMLQYEEQYRQQNEQMPKVPISPR